MNSDMMRLAYLLGEARQQEWANNPFQTEAQWLLDHGVRLTSEAAATADAMIAQGTPVLRDPSEAAHAD